MYKQQNEENKKKNKLAAKKAAEDLEQAKNMAGAEQLEEQSNNNASGKGEGCAVQSQFQLQIPSLPLHPPNK